MPRPAPTAEALARALAPRARAWAPFRIPWPPAPAVVKRASACTACQRGKLPLRTCRCCGRRLCDHRFHGNGSGYDVFADGTGICRRCRWARARAFNLHFKLGASAPDVEPPGEDD